MARVVSHSEIEALSPGSVLEISSSDIVTPLAEENAKKRGVVIARSGGGSEDDAIRETIFREVMAALGQGGSVTQGNGRQEVAPGIDYCAMCVEQERERSRTRAVLTTTGRNTKGIVARLTARIAELGGDILDISQTLVGDYFTMIIVVDTASLDAPFATFKENIEADAHSMGLQTMMMHEDVVTSLHRV